MILPQQPNLTWLFSFWIGLNVLLTILGVALISVFMSPVWSLAILVLVGGIGVAGLVKPQVISRPYRVWNNIANKYAEFIRAYILRICFFTVFLGLSRTKSDIRVARAENSASYWEPSYASGMETCVHTTEKHTGSRWVSQYTSWSYRSGNLWACSLLPFIFLLMMLEAEEADSLSDKLYTLF